MRTLVLCLVWSLVAAAPPSACGVQQADDPTAAALVVAGNGPQNFETGALFEALAGHMASAEWTKLRFQFGSHKVTTFSDVFAFVVTDVVEVDAKSGVQLSPAIAGPHAGKPLAAAVVRDATTPDGSLDVDTLFQRLLACDRAMHVRADLERHFAATDVADYRAVLLQSIRDMKRYNNL